MSKEGVFDSLTIRLMSYEALECDVELDFYKKLTGAWDVAAQLGPLDLDSCDVLAVTRVEMFKIERVDEDFADIDFLLEMFDLYDKVRRAFKPDDEDLPQNECVLFDDIIRRIYDELDPGDDLTEFKDRVIKLLENPREGLRHYTLELIMDILES